MGQCRVIQLLGIMGLSLLVTLTVGCQKPQEGLTVVGSTSVQPFAEVLAEEYMVQHRQEKIYVQGGGSSAGIQAVQTGAAQIGMASRSLAPSESALIGIPIAYDAIAVIVHPTNPIGDLSIEQIRKIFSGKVSRWNELGGKNHEITLVSREEGSGTREAFQHLLMGKAEVSLAALVQDSNGAIRQVVSDDPMAIGYISLGLVNKRVKALRIGGGEPTIENIKSHRYILVRPFLFVFKREPVSMEKIFLDFVLSPGGQKLLTREGLISVSSVSALQKGSQR